MRLLVLRHGLAEEASPGSPDEGRRLTPKGRRRLEQACRGLARLIAPGRSDRRRAPAPVVVASSPLVRARESADILAEALRERGCDEIHRKRLAHLVPPADPRAVADWLAARKDGPCALMVLVGHEPHLGRLVTLLVGGHDGSRVRLGKGGAALFEVGARAPVRAELLWLLKACHLRAMR